MYMLMLMGRFYLNSHIKLLGAFEMFKYLIIYILSNCQKCIFIGHFF